MSSAMVFPEVGSRRLAPLRAREMSVTHELN